MLITNFASGELSQSLNGRVDIQQYYQGAARIENFEIIPTGGIKRRVGTQRLAELTDKSRIIPFIVNKNKVYILELCLNPSYNPNVEGSKHSLIKVWQRGVTGNYSVIQTLGCDWGNMADINALQYAQNYDTLIFVHKSYRPYQLTELAGTFTGEYMDFDFIPDVELDDDFDYIMIPSSGWPTKETTADGHGRFTYNKLINGVETLYTKDFAQSIKDFFCIKDGKLYKWGTNWEAYGTDPEIDTELFTEEGKFPSCVAFFNNRLYFASTTVKPQMVWASAAPDNYGTRYRDFATYKKFITVNKITKDADLHLFTCDLFEGDIDTTNHRTTFRNVTQNFTAAGTLKAAITDYFVSSSILPVGTKVVSVTENTITVNTDNVSVVWDDEDDLQQDPQTEVNNNSNQSNTSQSNTSGSETGGSSGSETSSVNTGTGKSKKNIVMSIQLWRSVDSVTSEDFEYAVVANNITTADCSLFFELASDQNDAIMFLSSNRFLAVGTESSIWSIDPGISALSINAVMQGRYGSDEIQGQAVETATVYFAQGKKGIREFYYDGESKAFRTNNIALLADHILRESAVVDFDYMTNPYSRLVIVREDGTAAVMLYDKTNGIMAWSRIITASGKIRNCAVTRGYDENDLVFFVVEEGSGQNVRYFLELYDLGNSIYMDGWKFYTAALLNDYGEGAILWNKSRDKTCPYDNIPDDFYDEGDEVYIGYDYKSYIKSMPVVAGELSKRQRIASLYVRFLNSYLPVVKVTSLTDEKFTTITQLPYSGVGKVNYPGSTDRDVCFELEAAGPKPVNILTVEAQMAN